MAEILFKGNGVISLGSIERDEDLKQRPGMNINPPPSDGRCMCCGKHISELTTVWQSWRRSAVR